jgi:hypothetical protein
MVQELQEEGDPALIVLLHQQLLQAEGKVDLEVTAVMLIRVLAAAEHLVEVVEAVGPKMAKLLAEAAGWDIKIISQ